MDSSSTYNHSPYRLVPKPWGHEVWFAFTDRYVGKILHINSGESLSLQYHNQKDESIMVLSGELSLWLEDEVGQLQEHLLQTGQAQRILPQQRHRMVAMTDVEICEVSTPEVDDVVRLEDKYGRS